MSDHNAQPEKRTEERTETHACDLIDRQAAQTELMMKCERYTLARESHGMGHVEWSSDLISVADAMDAIRGLPSAQPQRNPDEWCHDCKEYDQERNCCPRWNRVIRETLSEQTEWNNHTVACLLAELFGDACACNFNGIDEWLPEKCEVIDACPNPVGVACWEQFLKHRAERRTDGKNT